MGLKERVEDILIRLSQRFVQHALVKEDGTIIPVNYIERDGHLVAFFPNEKTEFRGSIQGLNQRSLANAYLLGFVKKGDTLLVKYKSRPDLLEVEYGSYTGFAQRVRRSGDTYLHWMPVVDQKVGIHYGGEITSWEKVDVTFP